MLDDQDQLPRVRAAQTSERAGDRKHDVAELVLSDEMVLAALAQHAHAARGAYAANTERALRADTAVFTAWCAEAGLASLPAQAGTIAAFVDAMSALKAPATIRRYVSSIAAMHRAAKLPSPCADDVVRLALRRLHRPTAAPRHRPPPSPAIWWTTC